VWYTPPLTGYAIPFLDSLVISIDMDDSVGDAFLTVGIEQEHEPPVMNQPRLAINRVKDIAIIGILYNTERSTACSHAFARPA
jgi:hypothetical protein